MRGLQARTEVLPLVKVGKVVDNPTPSYEKWPIHDDYKYMCRYCGGDRASSVSARNRQRWDDQSESAQDQF